VIGADNLQNAEFKMPEEVRKKFLEGFETNFKETMRGGFSALLAAKADPELNEVAFNQGRGSGPENGSRSHARPVRS
jgi:hypothetical protein